MRKNARWIRLLAVVMAAIMLTGCGSLATSEDSEQSKKQSENIQDAGEIPMASADLFAMDTYMTVTGYGEHCEEAVQAAMEEIQRLDALFSVGNEESEIATLNREGSVTLSEDTAVVIQQALELYESTAGVFDISVYPLMELWGFTTGVYQEPSEAAITNTLELVDASKIQYDAKTRTVTIQFGQGIDLGGIAKGYTSDRIMEIFAEYDMVSGLIDLGGNIECYKGKTDGSPWRCGIQDPNQSDGILGVVSVKDKAVISSGGYERFFTDEITGKTWHHIIDPTTGYSAEQGLVSVTIVSEKGILADGLSTSMYIMGLEKATAYWQDHSQSFDMILVAADGQIYVTEGIADSVTCDAGFEVICK